MSLSDMTGTKELFGSSITENHEVTVDSEIETAGFKYHTFIKKNIRCRQRHYNNDNWIKEFNKTSILTK